MNTFMQQHGAIYRLTQVMRDQLMDIIADSELAFTPGGSNPTLGELCKEMGEVEYSYIQSIQTLSHDWMYRNAGTNLANSVDQLKVWYKQLDSQLQTAMENLSDDDLNKMVKRNTGEAVVNVGTELHIYREALLIFYSKVAVYLKAMNKTMPKQWQGWIG